MSYVKTHLVARRNARGGRSATEHLVAALRCLYKHAEDDRYITPGEHARPAGRHHEEPAQAHPVPARPHRRMMAQTGLSIEPEPPETQTPAFQPL